MVGGEEGEAIEKGSGGEQAVSRVVVRQPYVEAGLHDAELNRGLAITIGTTKPLYPRSNVAIEPDAVFLGKQDQLPSANRRQP